MAEKDRLSRDIAKKIKLFSFNNLRVFYSKYEKELDMALTTFYKVMEGGYVKKDSIKRVEAIAESLVYASASTVTRREVFDELIVRIKKFNTTEKMEDWLRVKEWLISYEAATDHMREVDS